MEKNYLKIASIKFEYNNDQSQANEIFKILDSFTDMDTTNFNFQSLTNIYSKNVLNYLIDLLLSLPNNNFSLCTAIYLSSQFDVFDNSTNDRLITKLLSIIQCTINGELTFKILQTISLTYSSIMERLISENLLDSVCKLQNKLETPIFEKIIFLTIQEIKIVDLRFFGDLQCLGEDLFLRLISAVSVTASVTQQALLSEMLWNVILRGLVSIETVDRKRAMYWLNRTLHTCKSLGLTRLSVDLSHEILFLDLDCEIINTILIIIDCLEEKQTHVIIPVLPKIDYLKHCLVNQRLSFHWLLVIVERACLHESTVILKWALSQFLCLPWDLSVPSFNRILSTSFIRTINQSSLYFSPESISNDTGFFASSILTDFFSRLFNELSLSEQSIFIDTLSTVQWNAHALLFVAESFSRIVLQHTQFPIILLAKFATICRYNLVTFNLKYRQCIVSFFLIGFFRNHQINADEISDFISIVQQNFIVSETILIDQTLLDIFSNQFNSLSSHECEKILVEIINIINQSEINDCNFLTTCNKMSCLSLILVLLSRNDAKIDLRSILTDIIMPVKDTYMNPYANFSDVLKSIIVIKQLNFVVKKVDDNSTFCESVARVVSSVFVEITSYLGQQIDNSECQIDYVSVAKYFIANFPADAPRLVADACTSISTLIAVNSADITCDLNASCILRNHSDPLQYEKITCLSRHMVHYKPQFGTTIQISELVDSVCEFIEITVPYRGIIAVIRLCGSMLNHLYDQQSATLIVGIIHRLWSSILEHNSSAQTFWKLYTVYLTDVVEKMLQLYYNSNDQEVLECLEELVEAILKMGQNKFGMVHLLGEMVHDFFVTNNVTVNDNNSEFFIGLIGRLVVYGPCHRRGLRFENRIERYLNNKYGARWNTFRINKTAESGERVGGLLILCLTNAFPLSAKEEMLKYLRNKDQEIMANNTKGYKNYANNSVHRTRHRLFSVLLMLLNGCVQSLSHECITDLEQWMISSIQFESLNSIRHLSEWIYTILCSHDLSKQANLVRVIQLVTDNKPAYVCSLITICRHLAVINTGLVDDLVLSILPLGSAQNYNIRLYAMSFIKIVQQQQLIDASNAQLSVIIDNYVAFLERSTTCKNIKKLLSNFWWTKFDPIKDICLETIFQVLPPLFDMVEEEIITLDQFMAVANRATLYDIRFDNQRPEWAHTDDSVWRVKTEMSSPDDESDSTVNNGSVGDVQKKIQPWITCRPDEDMLRELYGARIMASDLVLVCSLIEKATNIGGLARTSNIFGVGEFVVGNLRIVEDNSFKQLAVTADKWINMTEVAIKELARFIALKRSTGYEIVGIEQTANSVSLESMKFKPKTVLLLGNEKEGIPAELISHMDYCIQIPQLGQIRSLNVHVSGAIVLWEYMKQIQLSSSV